VPLLEQRQVGSDDEADRAGKDETRADLFEQGRTTTLPDQDDDAGAQEQVDRSYRYESDLPGYPNGVGGASHQQRQEQQGKVQANYDECPRTEHVWYPVARSSTCIVAFTNRLCKMRARMMRGGCREARTRWSQCRIHDTRGQRVYRTMNWASYTPAFPSLFFNTFTMIAVRTPVVVAPGFRARCSKETLAP